MLFRSGKVQYQWPENRLVRSQDLENWYHDCGQYYFLRVSSFLKQKSLIMENTIPVIVNEMEVQDIDNYDDWNLAEVKYQIKSKRT